VIRVSKPGYTFGLKPRSPVRKFFRRPGAALVRLEGEQADLDSSFKYPSKVGQDLRLDERLAKPEVTDI
jgi:hypothetical protein